MKKMGKVMSKAVMILVISFVLSGWICKIQAAGPQSFLPSDAAQGIVSFLQSISSNDLMNGFPDTFEVNPLTMFSPVQEYLSEFGFFGTIPLYSGLDALGTGLPGLGFLSPFSQLGYSAGFGIPAAGLLPMYGGLPGFTGAGMLSVYGGLPGFAGAGIYPPLYGHSPLTSILQPGHYLVGGIEAYPAGMEYGIIMPPSTTVEGITPTDIRYQGQLGVPIPEFNITLDLPGYEEEITNSLYFDPFTGMIYPVWNTPWWSESESGTETE